MERSPIHKESEMNESRIMILDYVSEGRLSVPEAVTLLRVLAEIEALDICFADPLSAGSIEIYLN